MIRFLNIYIYHDENVRANIGRTMPHIIVLYIHTLFVNINTTVLRPSVCVSVRHLGGARDETHCKKGNNAAEKHFNSALYRIFKSTRNI